MHIWFEEEPFEPVNCTIYDMMGNAVLMKSVEQTLNEITTSLPVGIYVVQLYNNNFSFAQQVIIQ
ncbi:MAG: T9SS type A sorting domain-containing protein [Bacteroidetes bacterium]|nr:T9SS type A sorting domain-containing protein [Bacteroidota bacterium]